MTDEGWMFEGWKIVRGIGEKREEERWIYKRIL